MEFNGQVDPAQPQVAIETGGQGDHLHVEVGSSVPSTSTPNWWCWR